MLEYYEKKLFLAELDLNDNIAGKIERWQAHKEGVLHRGFTAVLTYQDNIVLQHRKHPAFDCCFDLTFSSHQNFIDENLQTDTDAIYEALKREWNIERSELVDKPKFLGRIYYKARDPQSVFTEHEIDHIYRIELKNPPTPNLDFAYGFKLINKLDMKNFKSEISKLKTAPWVDKIVELI